MLGGRNTRWRGPVVDARCYLGNRSLIAAYQMFAMYAYPRSFGCTLPSVRSSGTGNWLMSTAMMCWPFAACDWTMPGILLLYVVSAAFVEPVGVICASTISALGAFCAILSSRASRRVDMFAVSLAKRSLVPMCSKMMCGPAFSAGLGTSDEIPP